MSGRTGDHRASRAKAIGGLKQMENTNRTIAQIANDMDRIAARRADVNRLNGAKLRAYKILEIELNVAKAAGNADSSYMIIASQIKTELGLA